MFLPAVEKSREVKIVEEVVKTDEPFKEEGTPSSEKEIEIVEEKKEEVKKVLKEKKEELKKITKEMDEVLKKVTKEMNEKLKEFEDTIQRAQEELDRVHKFHVLES